jgi:hypothetical protein
VCLIPRLLEAAARSPECLQLLGVQARVLGVAETLAFPWWMAGKLGEILAKPILTALWKGNLRRLAKLL